MDEDEALELEEGDSADCLYWMRRCFTSSKSAILIGEATENRKRIIRRKANKFEIQDGELYYRDNRKSSGGKVTVALCHILGNVSI